MQFYGAKKGAKRVPKISKFRVFDTFEDRTSKDL